jgi:hypothetical protein
MKAKDKEAKALSDALTKATAEAWRPGACGDAVRVSDEIRVSRKTDPWFGQHCEIVNVYGRVLKRLHGDYRLLGWDDRLAHDAGLWLRGAHPDQVREQSTAAPAVSSRDARRAVAYRALLKPDSGASESERVQARQHLERLGAA